MQAEWRHITFPTDTRQNFSHDERPTEYDSRCYQIKDNQGQRHDTENLKSNTKRRTTCVLEDTRP